MTEGADSSSGAGAVIITGSGALTEAPDTAAGTAALIITGSGAITEQPDVMTGVQDTFTAVPALPRIISTAPGRIISEAGDRILSTEPALIGSGV